MDDLKTLAQGLLVAGMVFVWPGPELLDVLKRDEQPAPAPVEVRMVAPAKPKAPPANGAEWLAGIRHQCNAIEVDLATSLNPAPETFDGTAHAAACFALAGRIAKARSLILGLEEDKRWQAAGVLFETTHPVADAGHDEATGAVMELVIEFWPNHYMALYHAGSARYGSGDMTGARSYLERFLASYPQEDGWSVHAQDMLDSIPVQ